VLGIFNLTTGWVSLFARQIRGFFERRGREGFAENAKEDRKNTKLKECQI
jgi:hypothetical protein